MDLKVWVRVWPGSILSQYLSHSPPPTPPSRIINGLQKEFKTDYPLLLLQFQHYKFSLGCFISDKTKAYFVSKFTVCEKTFFLFMFRTNHVISKGQKFSHVTFWSRVEEAIDSKWCGGVLLRKMLFRRNIRI